MPKPAVATREHILQTAYELFYNRGFARVGMDAVAERAGVTKRTIYYHFTSKDALLAAVLDHHGDLALERIRRWGALLSGDAGQLIDGLFTQLADWAATPRWHGAGFTRLVMELADLPGHPARAIARRHKATLEAWIAAELEARAVPEPDRQARLLMILLEGTTSLLLIHADRRYAVAAGAAARALLAAS